MEKTALPLVVLAVVLEQSDQTGEVVLQAENVGNSTSTSLCKGHQVERMKHPKYVRIVTFL